MNKTIDTQGFLVTTEEYKGYSIVTRSRKNSGVRSHCVKDNKCMFSLRFPSIDFELLSVKMKQKIDKL